MGRGFRANFLTGLIVLAPIGASLFITWFLIIKVGNILGQIFQLIPTLSRLPSQVISVIGFVAILLLIYIVGLLTTVFIGRWALSLGEGLLLRVPLVKTIYTSAKELVQNLMGERTAFRKVVFIEFPRKGLFTLAFLTGEPRWNLGSEEGKGDPIRVAQGTQGVNIFVPTCPNPTSGYFVVVPEEDVIETNLSVEWALKIIISGGMVVPEERVIQTTGKL